MKTLFVTCPHGFELILQKELESLGVQRVSTSFCGVRVPKTLENVWICNYESRVATRVLFPIAEFSCQGRDDLYYHASQIDWTSFLNCDKTFAIDANVQHPKLTNSLFAALVVKDAICDFFRKTTQSRPSIDTTNPDVQLNLFIQKQKATLYFDTSGAPLHKRGWRTSESVASIHESLAAGLLLKARYTKEHIFCDPFAGSGTFLVEAGLIATNTPPGFFRKKWGFFHLKEHQHSSWVKWKEQRDAKRVIRSSIPLFGSDKSREVSEICKTHLAKAFINAEISYEDISRYRPNKPLSMILTNPPYGKRLEVSESLFSEFNQFLDFYPNAEAHILCPEHLNDTILKRQVRDRFFFKNGGLPIKVLSI